ncbi:hypothetical protein F3Y22_tig00110676pilonHSYRG00287 [Hibiscus syriacus]|uniref:Uncharacterized protein n=1 Tax=Hibiscus syriacus TaxID=106335 RepID=A0A6A2ZYG5_HIBSY|nr:hypothetical protein F3Y22_tig00110676pilonHSYRG00287 [Hibiscus syriacus]
MKGLDGIRGPIYFGTGCVFRRQALYGFDAPVTEKPPGKTCNCLPKWCCCLCCSRKKKKTKQRKEKPKKFKLREASKQIHALENIEEGIIEVIGHIGNENGKEIRSVPSFCGYGGGLKWLERFSYINSVVYPWTSIPLVVYCTLPAICLLTGQFIVPEISNYASLVFKRFSYINSVVYPWTSIPLVVYCTLPAICLLTGQFIVPEISNYASLVFMLLFISIAVTGVLEMQWGGAGIDDCTSFTVTSMAADDSKFSERYIFKWTSLLIPPTTLLIIDAINNGYGIRSAIFHLLGYHPPLPLPQRFAWETRQDANHRIGVVHSAGLNLDSYVGPNKPICIERWPRIRTLWSELQEMDGRHIKKRQQPKQLEVFSL